MCGAFSVIHPFKEIGRPFNAGYNGPDQPPRYNARPGQLLPTILNSSPAQLTLAKWGFEPAWSKARPIINARKESLDTKITFKDAFRKRRCLIPADGFYEWGIVNESKIPFRFLLKSRGIFAFAGIWQQEKNTGQPTFAIITTEPNPLVAKIHDRMPAILPAHQESLWISNELSPAEAMGLLEPYPASLMEAYPVSVIVNSAKNDSPEVIKPIKM